MKKRCPDAMLVGPAFLHDYKIAFTIFSKKRNCGCADIIQSTGDVVWGLLYEVSESDLMNLDKEEGHPNHYKRFQVEVRDTNEQSHIAETYEVATKEADFLKPSKEYLGLMVDAAITFNFPAEYRNYISKIETSD